MWYFRILSIEERVFQFFGRVWHTEHERAEENLRVRGYVVEGGGDWQYRYLRDKK